MKVRLKVKVGLNAGSPPSPSLSASPLKSACLHFSVSQYVTSRMDLSKGTVRKPSVPLRKLPYPLIQRVFIYRSIGRLIFTIIIV